MKFQGNQVGLKVNGTHQFVAHVDSTWFNPKVPEI
jgi:hypothetical protein